VVGPKYEITGCYVVRSEQGGPQNLRFADGVLGTVAGELDREQGTR